jgi:hypothetical protein
LSRLLAVALVVAFIGAKLHWWSFTLWGHHFGQTALAPKTHGKL